MSDLRYCSRKFQIIPPEEIHVTVLEQNCRYPAVLVEKLQQRL
jgi:hypothetical protein